MASDEILFKVAADLSGLKDDFQDLSAYWDKHNKDIAKGEKAMNDYADSTVKDFDKINNKLKENIKQLAAEGKAVNSLDKQFQALKNNNKATFDNQQLAAFNETLAKVSDKMNGLEALDLNLEDLDSLSQKLNIATDDFEVLNTLVEFFDGKLKTASVNTIASFDEISKKIEETELNIKSTEDYIKSVNDQIKNTAPGKFQAELIQEREAAKQALVEEKVALADYKQQVKAVAKENVSLETQLRRVKDELIELELEGKRGSARWEELRDKAAQYNEVIKHTNDELNRSASYTSSLDNLVGAVSGLVGLYSAAAGATSLFGDESEELEQTLIKLNGAIALLNGLQAVQAELAKKDSLSYRALVAVQKQYTVAVDASAKATTRLLAASKLLGIGLLVGALAAIVVYWEDIAKWMGVVNEETERNNALNETAINNASAEIGRLKALQIELQNVNTPLDRQKEIRSELLQDYPKYLKVLGDEKASVEDINTAFENLNKALLLNAKLTAAKELISTEFKKVLEAERAALEGEATTYQTVLNTLKNIIIAGPTGNAGALTFVDNLKDSYSNLDEAKANFEDFQTFIANIINGINTDLNNLGGTPGDTSGDGNNNLEQNLKKYSDLINDLIKQKQEYQRQLLESDREREKAALNAQLEEEKAGYLKQIEALEGTEEEKLAIRKKYDEIYNEETGTAYEQLRKQINEIDEKYNKQFEESRFNAISAINEVYNQETRTERLNIAKKWDTIREDLKREIEETKDFLKREELQSLYNFSFTAQNDEIFEFDRNASLERVERERGIAESVLKIYQANAKDIIDNEQLKARQLLEIEQQYLNQILKIYRDSLKFEDQSFFDQLLNTLQTSTNVSEIQEVGDKLRQAFGDETANDILNTVNALSQVRTEINDINELSGFERLIADLDKWTESVESFSLQLGKSLGLQEDALIAFAKSLTNSIRTVFNGLNDTFQAEIDYHQERIDAINESIDLVERQLDTEADLREKGYANNYELRQKELQDLKDLKRQEEEELKKSQERKNKLAKAELLANAAQQTSNLITAGTEIIKAHSGIPFAGILLAAGYIASMFALFAQFKSQAQQAQSFRQGLKEGALTLNGPRHEQGGFGLYDSKSGRKVAEFEDGEDVYVSNRSQKQKYKHVFDALIADAQGRGNLDDILKQKYGVPEVGKQTTQVVRHINRVTVQAAQAKEQAQEKGEEVTKAILKLRDDFNREFNGYKNERDNDTKSWETPEYFHVKKGQTTKKYPKK